MDQDHPVVELAVVAAEVIENLEEQYLDVILYLQQAHLQVQLQQLLLQHKVIQ